MYNAYFHCRLCDKIYYSCGTNSEQIVLHSMCYLTNSTLSIKELPSQCPNKFEIHLCEDGSYGMADFIGFKKVDK